MAGVFATPSLAIVTFQSNILIAAPFEIRFLRSDFQDTRNRIFAVPDFKGIDNFYLILFFITPGLIIIYVRSRFIAGRRPSHNDNLLSYFTLSIVYTTMVFPFIDWAFINNGPNGLRAIVWSLLGLIGPTAFGLFLAAWAQNDWGARLASIIGLEPIHAIPTAWDWRFSVIPKDGRFIMVTLTNGENVAGLWADASFASTDSGERDLYIQEEYTIKDNGEWTYREDKVGILIPFREIRYVEFWEPKPEVNHEQ